MTAKIIDIEKTFRYQAQHPSQEVGRSGLNPICTIAPCGLKCYWSKQPFPKTTHWREFEPIIIITWSFQWKIHTSLSYNISIIEKRKLLLVKETFIPSWLKKITVVITAKQISINIISCKFLSLKSHLTSKFCLPYEVMKFIVQKENYLLAKLNNCISIMIFWFFNRKPITTKYLKQFCSVSKW